ncbi:DNA annealing helicase and endonuclease ZRANB3 isoform X1, partial [Tachysurus ichikawai]
PKSKAPNRPLEVPQTVPVSQFDPDSGSLFIYLVLGLLLTDTVCNLRGISQSKVTVLGYGLLTNDAQSLVETLKKQRFGVVIVDESHYLKSRNAARTKILVPLIQNAKRAILLTGTPALGRPEEVAET